MPCRRSLYRTLLHVVVTCVHCLGASRLQEMINFGFSITKALVTEAGANLSMHMRIEGMSQQVMPHSEVVASMNALASTCWHIFSLWSGGFTFNYLIRRSTSKSAPRKEWMLQDASKHL